MLDAWDIMALLSCTAVIVGIALIFVPAAFIMAGLIGLVIYFIREWANVPVPRHRENPPDSDDGAD